LQYKGRECQENLLWLRVTEPRFRERTTHALDCHWAATNIFFLHGIVIFYSRVQSFS
jgi:hypothetical protein